MSKKWTEPVRKKEKQEKSNISRVVQTLRRVKKLGEPMTASLNLGGWGRDRIPRNISNEENEKA